MSYLYRPAWLVVLTVALATSWWSLYSVAMHYAVPAVLAVGVSAIFDGAAIVVAALCQRYATTGDSGAGPRLFLLVLLAGSVLLNVQHARLAGYGLPAMVLFAAPACVAIVLFELEQGFRNRERRRAVGRVAPALPAIGRWGWLFYPARSLQVLRAATREHLETLRLPEGPLTGLVTQVPAASLSAADRFAPTQAAPVDEPATDRSEDSAARPSAAGPAAADAAGQFTQPPVTQHPAPDRAGAADPRAGTEALNVVFAAPTDTSAPPHPPNRLDPTPRPGPAAGRAARPSALADHPAGRPALAAVPGRRRLAELPSDAARARLAAATLGTDRPGELARWLAEQGHPVTTEAIRSALRRHRPTDRPLDRPATGDASG